MRGIYAQRVRKLGYGNVDYCYCLVLDEWYVRHVLEGRLCIEQDVDYVVPECSSNCVMSVYRYDIFWKEEKRNRSADRAKEERMGCDR